MIGFQEFIVLLAGFLTLSIYSFLFKENPLYRFAEHLYVGVSAGYLVARAVNDVLVFVNGICLTPTDDYTISGTNLTFATAPASRAEITFRILPIA